MRILRYIASGALILCAMGCTASRDKQEKPTRYAELTPEVKRLVESGADIDTLQPFCDAGTALGEAVNRMAVSGCYTPLHIAVMVGTEEAVQILIDNGARLDVRDPVGATPLHRAARKGFIDSARLLVEAGADVDSRDMSGRTPLFWAVSGDAASIDMVRLLVEAGTDLHIRDEGGNTVLHEAVHSNAEIVSYLIGKGIDVNACTYSGYFPINKACIGADVEVLEVLAANGAEINARGGSGRTPLAEAIFHSKNSDGPTTPRKQKAIIQFLRSKGAVE